MIHTSALRVLEEFAVWQSWPLRTQRRAPSELDSVFEEGALSSCCWYLGSLEKSFLDLELSPLRKSAAHLILIGSTCGSSRVTTGNGDQSQMLLLGGGSLLGTLRKEDVPSPLILSSSLPPILLTDTAKQKSS